ncbi:hypothetical protein [Sedimentisphaera salicampi]|uniref:hypothetical protein n=1 Tax=Sedimentisphaera salicampi TaxID=1941349 RepID=UPI000B9B1630|nr:hypothetical protein [Sedimentisphaera salicampi]OXU14829.1 hypothetical protein SMSP1_01324 [Sedimentisphaera salicampi]
MTKKTLKIFAVTLGFIAAAVMLWKLWNFSFFLFGKQYQEDYSCTAFEKIEAPISLQDIRQHPNYTVNNVFVYPKFKPRGEEKNGWVGPYTLYLSIYSQNKLPFVEVEEVTVRSKSLGTVRVKISKRYTIDESTEDAKRWNNGLNLITYESEGKLNLNFGDKEEVILKLRIKVENNNNSATEELKYIFVPVENSYRVPVV